MNPFIILSRSIDLICYVFGWRDDDDDEQKKKYHNQNKIKIGKKKMFRV